jgi:hypothetical protein
VDALFDRAHEVVYVVDPLVQAFVRVLGRAVALLLWNLLAGNRPAYRGKLANMRGWFDPTVAKVISYFSNTHINTKIQVDTERIGL